MFHEVIRLLQLLHMTISDVQARKLFISSVLYCGFTIIASRPQTVTPIFRRMIQYVWYDTCVVRYDTMCVWYDVNTTLII